MRKSLFTAFAAFAVGLLQAASLDWGTLDADYSKTGITSAGYISANGAEVSLGSDSWTIACIVTVNGPLSAYSNVGQKYPSIIGVTTSNTSGTASRFNVNADGKNSGTIAFGSNGTTDRATRTDAPDVTFQGSADGPVSYEFVISHTGGVISASTLTACSTGRSQWMGPSRRSSTASRAPMGKIPTT